MNNDPLNVNAAALLKALPYITTLVDGETRAIQQFNAEGTPLLTVVGEEFLADSTPEFSELLRAAAQAAIPTRFETQFMLSPSESRWYEHEVVIVPESPAIVLSRDITQRKAAEAEHFRTKRRYDAIVQNVSDAITISTWGTSYDDNVLLEANQRALDLLGYSLDELRSMRPSDFFAEEYYKSQAYRNRMLRETSQSAEGVTQFPIRRKDGSIRFVESLPVLIKDNDDQIIEAMAMVRDVTERIQREEQLRQAKLAAEAALTARDVFVANMSEELRQPLRDIVEHTRLLFGRAGTGTPADILERLHRIHEQAENLYRQISDVLDLSRVEAGFDAVTLSMFNLPHLLRRLEETLRLKAYQRDLALDFAVAVDLPILIQTDETKLKQILVNVIGDALKVTGRDSVSVRALRLPNHVLRFEIADTRKSGEYPADGESSPYHSLGIAISARLVDVLSGRLEIARTTEGMTITIDLPFVPVRSESPDDDSPALPSQGQLEQLSEAWLHEMYTFCIAGQVEQALAHVNALDPTQSDTVVQLSALITLFHLDRIADLIEPLIYGEADTGESMGDSL